MQEQDSKQGDHAKEKPRDPRDRDIEETATGNDPGGNPPPSGNPPRPPYGGPHGGGGKPGRD